MIIYHLLILLMIAAAIQPTREGRTAAFTFAGLSVMGAVVTGYIPDDFYHLAGAASDGLCAGILSQLGARSGIVRELQHLCFLAILINVGGFISYEMEYSALAYDTAGMIFYFITIMTLIMRRIGHANGTPDTYRPWFPVRFNMYYLDNQGY